MKRCPRCEKTYPDSETFCDADGTALVQAGPAFAESAASAGEGEQIECPVCGGKAQPGELICNFCGARLGVESAAEQYTPPPSRPVTSRAATSVRSSPSPSTRITGTMPSDDGEKEGRGMFGVLGYLIAAIVALGGGAWLALHLSNKAAEAPVANASPAAVASSAAAAAPTGPLVALANAMGVQVTGESAMAPERNQETARKFFEDHKDGLLDSYEHALAGDNTLRDGMVVRIRVLPNGSVDAASIRTSTNPNPAFDAEVVKDVSAWNFPPFSGSQVEVDYPMIFTNDPATRDALESQLSSKVGGIESHRGARICQLATVARIVRGRIGSGEHADTGRGRDTGCDSRAGPAASATASCGCQAHARAAAADLAAACQAGAGGESANAAGGLLHQRQHGDDFRQGVRRRREAVYGKDRATGAGRRQRDRFALDRHCRLAGATGSDRLATIRCGTVHRDGEGDRARRVP